MNARIQTAVFPILVLALSLIFAGCGDLPDQTPTMGPVLHPTSTGLPGPTVPSSPGPTHPTLPSPTPLPACTDRATFERDVTIPDDTVLLPGQSFVKTWRLLNSGTCAWTTEYDLVFVRGDHMGGPLSVPLPGTVPPGSTVDLSVDLTTPADEGTYEGRYMLRNAAGKTFGIGSKADGTFVVRVVVRKSLVSPTTTPVVPPTPTPVPPIAGWRGEYYGNPYLTGSPVVVRSDEAIDFDWGSGAPDASVSADNFSVRWTRLLGLEGGSYRFRAYVDDGVRLWVDGDLVLDAWADGARREVAADRALHAGNHTVRVEYYERTGGAAIQVTWEKLNPYPDWKGEYWSNPNLSGDPALVRNDVAIDFDWGTGAPAAGLPADRFSARWTRAVRFEAATYRFHVVVDDGARLWIDDVPIIDGWQGSAVRELTADYTLVRGKHTLRVEYYDQDGGAQVHLGWEEIPNPVRGDWRGSYWSNMRLRGSPDLVRDDPAIDFDWRSGAPSGRLPADKFSARWERWVEFEPGDYILCAQADDGIRVYLGDELAIDRWGTGDGKEVYKAVLTLAGSHHIVVEYYELSGRALARFWWNRQTIADTSITVPGYIPFYYPDWKGQYWPNAQLRGDPALVRNDASIDFNWGAGAPAPGLPADQFSARWERTVTLDPARYLFYARADNGIRVYLDGKLVIDAWQGNSDEVHMAEVDLSGEHRIVVEYVESGGTALARFWWHTVAASLDVEPSWRRGGVR